MFFGTHLPKLDEKGRLFLPAKYRDELAAGVVLTRGQEHHCLYVFPQADFTRMGEELSTSQPTARSARDHRRVFFASGFEQIPDKQGRITVPPTLREYAGLQRDCAVVGNNTRLEIWDAEAWESYLAELEELSSEAEEEVLPEIL